MNSFVSIFFISLLSALATMGADLETITLKGTRDEVPSKLIIALAKVADLKNDQNRTRIARSLGIKFEKSFSVLLFQPEIIDASIEFAKRKISDHLEHLMDNGVSSINIDSSPKLIAALAQLPADQVFEYLNKIQGASSFIIDTDPRAEMAQNPFIASCPMLTVFGKIINFINLSEEQFTPIVLAMPPLVIVDNEKTYKTSLKAQDLLGTSELKIAIQHSLSETGSSYIEMSLKKLKDLSEELNLTLDLRYEHRT